MIRLFIESIVFNYDMSVCFFGVLVKRTTFTFVEIGEEDNIKGFIE